MFKKKKNIYIKKSEHGVDYSTLNTQIYFFILWKNVTYLYSNVICALCRSESIVGGNG